MHAIPHSCSPPIASITRVHFSQRGMAGSTLITTIPVANAFPCRCDRHSLACNSVTVCVTLLHCPRLGFRTVTSLHHALAACRLSLAVRAITPDGRAEGKGKTSARTEYRRGRAPRRLVFRTIPPTRPGRKIVRGGRRTIGAKSNGRMAGAGADARTAARCPPLIDRRCRT